jgi:hypothetical protein
MKNKKTRSYKFDNIDISTALRCLRIMECMQYSIQTIQIDEVDAAALKSAISVINDIYIDYNIEQEKYCLPEYDE